MRIALLGDTDFSGYEMIFYYGKIIELTMIPEESTASLAPLCKGGCHAPRA